MQQHFSLLLRDFSVPDAPTRSNDGREGRLIGEGADMVSLANIRQCAAENGAHENCDLAVSVAHEQAAIVKKCIDAGQVADWLAKPAARRIEQDEPRSETFS